MGRARARRPLGLGSSRGCRARLARRQTRRATASSPTSGKRQTGLANQGWKDSWDSVAFADGRLADAPISLVEVQGYAYAALLGAAELAGSDAAPTRTRSPPSSVRIGSGRGSTNAFWDAARASSSSALDGAGRRVDSLTTNPGHALWTGIADPASRARIICAPPRSGACGRDGGMRTLAPTMARYDPLSYHNGSVWPHDTAIFAAGAARYGRWDVVDRIVDGALETASRLPRPSPGTLRRNLGATTAGVPVPYPASCSPQAWSSASILLMVRTMIGLDVRADRSDLTITRSTERSRHRLEGRVVRGLARRSRSQIDLIGHPCAGQRGAVATGGRRGQHRRCFADSPSSACTHVCGGVPHERVSSSGEPTQERLVRSGDVRAWRRRPVVRHDRDRSSHELRAGADVADRWPGRGDRDPVDDRHLRCHAVGARCSP